MPDADEALDLTETAGGVILRVRVVPRAKRSCLDGARGGALLVRLAAAPVDGAANDALLELLSSTLSVPRRLLSIASGERSRNKRVAVVGISAQDLRSRLQLA